jgi:chromosome segregation ATPase
MGKSTTIMIAALMITTTLAGCLGGTDEFDSSELEQQINGIQQDQNTMNQSVQQQIQSNLDSVATIASIQENLTNLQVDIFILTSEISNNNLTGQELAAQLIATQLKLASLQLEIANLTNSTTNTANNQHYGLYQSIFGRG